MSFLQEHTNPVSHVLFLKKTGTDRFHIDRTKSLSHDKQFS